MCEKTYCPLCDGRCEEKACVMWETEFDNPNSGWCSLTPNAASMAIHDNEREDSVLADIAYWLEKIADALEKVHEP